MTLSFYTDKKNCESWKNHKCSVLDETFLHRTVLKSFSSLLSVISFFMWLCQEKKTWDTVISQSGTILDLVCVCVCSCVRSSQTRGTDTLTCTHAQINTTWCADAQNLKQANRQIPTCVMVVSDTSNFKYFPTNNFVLGDKCLKWISGHMIQGRLICKHTCP